MTLGPLFAQEAISAVEPLLQDKDESVRAEADSTLQLMHNYGAIVNDEDVTEAARRDRTALDGRWVVSEELEKVGPLGKESPRWKGTQWTVHGNRIAITNEDGEDTASVDVAYRLHPDHSPKRIDLMFLMVGGEGLAGIYAVEGDTLKLCIEDAADGRRPLTFKSSTKPPQTVLIFKRIKDKVSKRPDYCLPACPSR